MHDDEVESNNDMSKMAMEKKADEIQRCLAGANSTSDDIPDIAIVDLWHLRTLALSSGGLINSTLRKRCWPKLLGLDEAILLHNTSPSSSMMTNSGNIRSLAASTLAIQSALAKVGKLSTGGGLLWDVEGQIKSNRRAREAERAMMLQSRLGGNDSDATAAAAVEVDVASVVSVAATVTSTTTSIAAAHQKQSRGKKMTKQELSILTNVLTAICKHTAFDTKTADAAVISQLANLAALLLINLESPSLTSLMMQSLAKDHLHLDASGKAAAEDMVDSSFWTVLDCADARYGAKLRGIVGDETKPFVTGWIASWFASALPTGLGRIDTTACNTANSLASIELEIASRFIDVFLCSHPLMPVYVSTALIKHPVNRKIVVEADVTEDIISNLPSIMVASILGITDGIFFDEIGADGIIIADERKVDLMEVVEDIITDAIDLMRSVPPSRLTDNSTSLPAHVLKSSAPTDFALIQQAKESRSKQLTAIGSFCATLSPMSEASEASTPTASPTASDSAKSSKFDFSDQGQDAIVVPTDEKYSLAVIAVGLSQPARPNSQSIKTWSAYMAVYLIGLAVAIASDRAIVNFMSDTHQPGIESSPVPAVPAKVSVPTSPSNALIPTSEVHNGISKPFSSVVVSSLGLQSVEQAFVHGASYIGATVGPVFGPVYAEEGEIDLDYDGIGANMTHRFDVIESLIAGALPATYYF